MGKSVAAPPPVNYQAAAQAQGAANVDAARTTARLSNPNINGPLGSQRVSYGTFDEAGPMMPLAPAAAPAQQQPASHVFSEAKPGLPKPPRRPTAAASASASASAGRNAARGGLVGSVLAADGSVTHEQSRIL
jgi:hypothetical protein